MATKTKKDRRIAKGVIPYGSLSIPYEVIRFKNDQGQDDLKVMFVTQYELDESQVVVKILKRIVMDMEDFIKE